MVAPTLTHLPYASVRVVYSLIFFAGIWVFRPAVRLLYKIFDHVAVHTVHHYSDCCCCLICYYYFEVYDIIVSR